MKLIYGDLAYACNSTKCGFEEKYNEISELSHQFREPVFITKNGKGDLAVMSIEVYEMLTGKMELYRLLDEWMRSR